MGQKKLVPLYHQIYLTLRNELLSGSFRNGGDEPPPPLPSENELADRYAVSRVTIRQALKTLETEGMVIRRHGVGTFPAALPDKDQLLGEAGDVYDDLDALTRDYDQKILSYERFATPGFILRRNPDFGERCLHLSVLSKRDSRPIHLHRQYVPERYGDLLGKRRPRQVSLLLELKKHGISAATINIDLSATAADMDTAGHLEVPVGSPLIATTRIALDADGEPVEHFEAFTRPDQYVYRFQLSDIDATSTLRQVFTK